MHHCLHVARRAVTGVGRSAISSFRPSARSFIPDALGASSSASSRLVALSRGRISPFSTSAMLNGRPSGQDKFKFGKRKELGLALASVAALTAATASESEVKAVKADDRSHELSGDEQRTVSLFERCSGSVVHISTFVKDKSLLLGMAHVDMQDIPQGTGSGFMWDSRHIVTNYHVIKDADKAMIVFADHTSREAFLVGHEPDFDLAVLRFEKPDELEIKALDKGSSSRLQVGQKVFAIGNPFGLDQTLTSGIVSGLGREMRGKTASLVSFFFRSLSLSLSLPALQEAKSPSVQRVLSSRGVEVASRGACCVGLCRRMPLLTRVTAEAHCLTPEAASLV